MENKLTENEIIKALECCRDCNCKECPCCRIIDGGTYCTEIDEEQILDLINRQKAEVERLQYVLMGVMHSVDKWLEGDELKQDETNRAATMREKTLQIVEGKQAEIERLKEEIRNTDNILNLLDRPLIEVKSEAIKEFAKRLKERVKSAWAKHFCVFPPPQNSDISQKYLKLEDFDKHINNLVKEMVGDTDV